MKITGNQGTTASGARGTEELSRSEQDSIMRLVNQEKHSARTKKEDKKPPMTVKYLVPRPPVNAKYLVVKPDVDAGNGPIAAKYMVVPSPIVAKYVIVPPWAGIDAHQAVINKATKDGGVTVSEAKTMAKLFNRDIAAAKKDGRDIRADVAKFLQAALKDVKLSNQAREILFGQGGPACLKKKEDKKTDGPIYIMPVKPKKKDDDGPIYIMPVKPQPNPDDRPIYIMPHKPTKK